MRGGIFRQSGFAVGFDLQCQIAGGGKQTGIQEHGAEHGSEHVASFSGREIFYLIPVCEPEVKRCVQSLFEQYGADKYVFGELW